MHALYHLRKQNLLKHDDHPEIENHDILRQVYEMVGGRTSYLVKVARADNMVEEAERMIENEMRWLGSK